MRRLLTGRVKLKYDEAGMDPGLPSDIRECFRMSQSRILAAYDAMAEEHGIQSVDAGAPVQAIQERLRQRVAAVLGGGEPPKLA